MTDDALLSAKLISMQSASSAFKLCMDFAKCNPEINRHFPHLFSQCFINDCLIK